MVKVDTCHSPDASGLLPCRDSKIGNKEHEKYEQSTIGRATQKESTKARRSLRSLDRLEHRGSKPGASLEVRQTSPDRVDPTLTKSGLRIFGPSRQRTRVLSARKPTGIEPDGNGKLHATDPVSRSKLRPARVPRCAYVQR